MAAFTPTVDPVTNHLEDWYRATIGTVSEREVLRRLRDHLGEPFDSRKIATHLRQSDPNARTVVAVARLFGASPVEGLRAAGLLSSHDLDAASTSAALREVSDKELADEVTRRLVERTYGSGGELNRPLAALDLPDAPGSPDAPGGG